MRWTLCGCGAADLVRVPRWWWMRTFFPSRRRYHCEKCGRSLFVPFDDVLVSSDPGNRMERRRLAVASAGRWALLLGVLAAGGWGVWREVDSRNASFAASSETLASAQALASTGRVAACHRSYVYKAGDTLESIAASELGADWHAQDIWVLNRALLDRLMLEDKGLEPGQALEIPTACASG
jgi:hypothetical protein